MRSWHSVPSVVRTVFVALTLLFVFAPMAPIDAQEAGAAAVSKPVTINLDKSQFDPQLQFALVNQSVVWLNKESLTHDVTAGDHSWHSPDLTSGQKFNLTFDKPGVYDYYCTKHSTGVGKAMWGRLIVTNAPALTPVGGGGVLPQKIGVQWLAHEVGVMSFLAVVAVLMVYFFVLKYGETVHATDHRDRKEK